MLVPGSFASGETVGLGATAQRVVSFRLAD